MGAVADNAKYDFLALAACVDWLSPMFYGYAADNSSASTIQDHKDLSAHPVSSLLAALAAIDGYA